MLTGIVSYIIIIIQIIVNIQIHPAIDFKSW